MKTKLPLSIKTIGEAELFLQALYDNAENYHLDDNANDIIWTTTAVSLQEMEKLNELRDQIFLLKKIGFDPYLFLLSRDPDYKIDDDGDDYLTLYEFVATRKVITDPAEVFKYFKLNDLDETIPVKAIIVYTGGYYIIERMGTHYLHLEAMEYEDTLPELEKLLHGYIYNEPEW